MPHERDAPALSCTVEESHRDVPTLDLLCILHDRAPRSLADSCFVVFQSCQLDVPTSIHAHLIPEANFNPWLVARSEVPRTISCRYIDRVS